LNIAQDQTKQAKIKFIRKIGVFHNPFKLLLLS